MKKIIVLAVALFLALPTVSFSYDGIVSGYITNVRVRLNNNGTDTNILVLEDTMSNPGSCSDPSWYVLVMDGTETPQAIYKTILLASTLGYEIKFELTGCHNGGTTGAPLITGSWIVPNQ